MSGIELSDQQLRNRRLHAQDEGPPVPPKTFNTENIPKAPLRRVAPRPLDLQNHSKPLPPVPQSERAAASKNEPLSKPLPLPPKNVTLRSTLLWVAALFVWFLLIVVLLPVITEKDAMPGFNKRLRSLL
ncbi:hypothetical protein IG631_12917 [Alternaria alternata]|nr:hypothetical protein IG631_12917 [Alternaria alternata]